MDIEAVFITDRSLQAHVHLPGGGHDIFSFDAPKTYHPAMKQAIEELEACVQGAITERLRTALRYAVPASMEPEHGLCKTCQWPVSTADPGAKKIGPFLYCFEHAP